MRSSFVSRRYSLRMRNPVGGGTRPNLKGVQGKFRRKSKYISRLTKKKKYFHYKNVYLFVSHEYQFKHIIPRVTLTRKAAVVTKQRLFSRNNTQS